MRRATPQKHNCRSVSRFSKAPAARQSGLCQCEGSSREHSRLGACPCHRREKPRITRDGGRPSSGNIRPQANQRHTHSWEMSGRSSEVRLEEGADLPLSTGCKRLYPAKRAERRGSRT